MRNSNLAKAKSLLESRGYSVFKKEQKIEESKKPVRKSSKKITESKNFNDFDFMTWKEWREDLEDDPEYEAELSIIDKLIKSARLNPNSVRAIDEEQIGDPDLEGLEDAIDDFISGASKETIDLSDEFKKMTDDTARAVATVYSKDGEKMLRLSVDGGYDAAPDMYIFESKKVNEGVGDMRPEPDGHTYYLLSLDRVTNMPNTKYYENNSAKAKEILQKAGIPESDIDEITQLGYDDITFVVKDKDKAQVNRIAHRLAAVAEPYSEENAREYDMRSGDTVGISGPYLENEEFDPNDDVEFWNM